jgi:hypothetical protein
MLSSASRVLIGGVDMAIVEGISYCTHNSLLTEDSSSGEITHARLGLDKHDAIGLLSDEKVHDLKPTCGNHNISKC